MNLHPPPPRSEQADDYHGTVVADPFRPLEDLDAPETRAWIEAQARRTEEYLGEIQTRDDFKRRLSEIVDYERRSVPVWYGDRYVFSINTGLQDQPVWHQAPSLEAPPSVLLDPNALSADGTVSIGALAPTRDGSLAAYALQRSGSDWLEWRVRRTSDLRDLDDVVRWSKFGTAAWMRNRSGFFYCRFPEPDPAAEFKEENSNEQVVFHRLGTSQDEDAVVYERPDDPHLFFNTFATFDGRFLVIDEHKEHGKNAFLVLDLDDPSAGIVRLREANALWSYVHNEGSRFYLRTDQDAPRGKIVALDLASPDELATIVSEGAATLQNAAVIGGKLITNYLRDVRTVLVQHDLDGRNAKEIALPGSGTAAVSGWPDRGEAFITYSDYTTPETIYRCDVAAGSMARYFAATPRFDSAAYAGEQIFATSKDGTRIPICVVAKKDIARDGERPTILYGYGGYNIAIVPSFSAFTVPWLEAGGILAVANLRGGSEYGSGWHEAGMLDRKQNVFDDFVASARELVARKYTSPKKLAIRGGSNGGLLVGATIVQQPALFGAAIAQVGVFDMLRFHKWTVGFAWIPEYGSPDDPDQFRNMFAYSPLHNLRAGTAYPATLIMTGDHDDRVFPAHSLKFAAALQEAQGGPGPILLRVESKAGHGAGTPLAKSLREWADIYAFLWGTLCS